MFYTIVPLEYIFDEEESEDNEPNKPKKEDFEIKREGVSLMVENLPSGDYQIKRIISTNPNDYLRSEWQPGAILSNNYRA
jgi:hypothetical protein